MTHFPVEEAMAEITKLKLALRERDDLKAVLDEERRRSRAAGLLFLKTFRVLLQTRIENAKLRRAMAARVEGG